MTDYDATSRKKNPWRGFLPKPTREEIRRMLAVMAIAALIQTLGVITLMAAI